MVGPCPRIRSHRATLRRCDFSAIHVEKGGEPGFSSGGATPWRSRPCAACGACMSTWFGVVGAVGVRVTQPPPQPFPDLAATTSRIAELLPVLQTAPSSQLQHVIDRLHLTSEALPRASSRPEARKQCQKSIHFDAEGLRTPPRVPPALPEVLRFPQAEQCCGNTGTPFARSGERASANDVGLSRPELGIRAHGYSAPPMGL